MVEEQKDLEVMAPNAIEALNRSEIESQIEIAKRYPRSLEKFKDRGIAMACIDEETAASCIYRRPVGKEHGQMKYAEGLSIRTAEIVGASYGNLRVYATLLSQTDRQVVARGMAIDLEANFASSSEVVESTVTSEGKPFSERMRAVVAKAALAKARRDATFQVVPKALARPIEQAVRQLLLGDAKSIATRQQQVSAWIKTLGIDEDRVWKGLGIGGLADIGLKELETLTGIKTAIKDGETSIDEAFPAEPIAIPQPRAPGGTLKNDVPAGLPAEPKQSGTVEVGREVLEALKARQAEKAKAPSEIMDQLRQPAKGKPDGGKERRAESMVGQAVPSQASDGVREGSGPGDTARANATGEDARQETPPDGKSEPEKEPAEAKAGGEPEEQKGKGSLKEEILEWISSSTTDQLTSKDPAQCYIRKIFNIKALREQLTVDERAEVLTAFDKERRSRPE